MRIRFLLARRVPDGPSQIVLAASEILSRLGFEVESMIAEEVVQRPERLGPDVDLWILKSYTPLSMTMAGVLHSAGARVLNPYPACLAARNKILAAQVLEAHGIPTPRSWITGNLALLAPLAREMPLVVKPAMGWRGEGVRIVRGEAELLALPPPSEPVLAQELVPGPGEDLRVYVAGDQVFATRKPFSSTSYSVPGQEVPVTEEIRRLALRCGEAFGLGLFGLDIIESPDGPRVVDVNYFPGYKGIARAPEAVASYIARYAQGRVSLDAKPSPRLAGGIR
jgi:ribosomal protein S6--L-glutamate ligase